MRISDWSSDVCSSDLARDLYLTPVMNELRPLLGLLFDDISITFDERTLLPQTILRRGQEEDVERLSGGMRERLSVLTRLAFGRSEEHTSELQSLMRISYAVFCLKKKKRQHTTTLQQKLHLFKRPPPYTI